MVQAASGEWLRRAQPTRHVRRETRWALQENDDRAPHARLPIVNGLKADISLMRVGRPLRRPRSGLGVYGPNKGIVEDYQSRPGPVEHQHTRWHHQSVARRKSSKCVL